MSIANMLSLILINRLSRAVRTREPRLYTTSWELGKWLAGSVAVVQIHSGQLAGHTPAAGPSGSVLRDAAELCKTETRRALLNSSPDLKL